MLIISRKKDQKIIIADDIEIMILDIGRNRVRFGINAPKKIAIQTRVKQAPEVEEGDGKPQQPQPFRVYPAAVGSYKRR